jgi:phthalate 4,5-cis-dihydrodiol dehydrogenase
MTTAAPAPAPSSDAKPIRLGVVGLGMAGGVMTAAVATHPEFVLAGAAEPNTELRERFAADNDVPAFADLEALVRRDDVDAVYVATPHQFHREHAVLAAHHGKHVVVEKPMALSLADCDAMVAAAEANKVKLIVGHTHGFDPALRVMRELIRDQLGPPALIASWNYTDFLYRPRRPEELDTDKGGGILFNQVPHQVDIVRTLSASPVRSVRATAARLDPERPTEGVSAALLQFEDGGAASIVYSGQDGFDSDELHGWVSEGGYAKTAAHGATKRALGALSGQPQEAELRRTRYGYGSALSVERPPHQPHFGELVVTCPGGEMRPSADGVMVYDQTGAHEVAVPRQAWRPGRGDVLEALRRAVVLGERPFHDGHFGRGTVAVCLAILASAREGREVLVEHGG